jgi:MTH538 TIR-like domain (DUF1863)
MARTVFFSFHYDPDWSRMWVVRNSGEFQKVAGNKDNVRLFLPRQRWEEVKRQGNRAIESWIDEGLKGSGVTVVLIGGDTWQRKWVRYEIEESERQKKGMLGVYIHNIRDLNGNYGAKGRNPFDYAAIKKSYSTYDWVNNRGYDNFSRWVEQAAIDAKR